MDITLDQRGRASTDFLVSFGRAAGAGEALIKEKFARAALTEETLADDLDERLETALSDTRALRARDMSFEWSSTHQGLIACEAFEAIRPEFRPQIAALAKGPTQIRTMRHFTPPPYLDDVWIYRTHGGWDEHEHQGLIHEEFIHKRYLTAIFGCGIFNTRRAVLDYLPLKDYQCIFEMGVSSGFHILSLVEAFPDTSISSCDVSRTMLEHGQRVANERGLTWDLYVARGEKTGLPAEPFELVSSFIILHKIPAEANAAFFVEAFRLFEPGSAVIMTDVPPYSELDKTTAWRFDLGALNGGEPYWREAGLVGEKPA